MLENEIEILAADNQGVEIPKPKAKAPFTIKSMGVRRGERALIYKIPSHSPKQNHYCKGITLSEFEFAYQRLLKTNELTRKWFNENMPKCAGEGSCNFTTVGGIFELLGKAKYHSQGRYIAASKA
ncbi:hypothetical protein [Shewanella surugensis]|uniref:Uncharacterized protein n=1 Tax=Shewanella surugensis TaxID=212020 RepID=A0ABT0LDU1_9GAMM|nr:hypothetical protein [Shewanella surugensis]MCL1125876.1 hypothetical protein [Shewanella surugensis]